MADNTVTQETEKDKLHNFIISKPEETSSGGDVERSLILAEFDTKEEVTAFLKQYKGEWPLQIHILETHTIVRLT